ncbi:MAG: minor capsid protein [Eubacterium sp.]|nr:minor capsid protein [Eubacterium sp.]
MALKKNNHAYWRKRFQLLEETQNKKGMQCCAEIERHYRRAQKEIEGKIAAWRQRFAANNRISMQQAAILLHGRELAEFQWDVQDYIRHGEENALDQRWMKELENASARYHISRLEALKLHMQQSLEAMTGNVLDSLDTAMRDIYKSGYYRTAYEIQKGIGVGWEFAALDEKTISKVIKTPWAADGRNFSERVWGNRRKLVNELNQALVQNMILGQNPQRAIDTIARKMKVSKQNAGKLVMTEEAFFSSAAQRDCFHELDVEQFEIVATLDDRTSKLCRQMDGQRFPMSQFEAGVTAPPFHVYCRSTTIPYFEDDFGVTGERAARGQDGKTYYVPEHMTYKQWEKLLAGGKAK